MILEDVVNRVYKQLIQLTVLPVYQINRPKNASGKYFVINCLGVNDGIPDQPAVINVNGYSPDISAEPDTASLKSLTSVAMQLDGQLKDNLNIYFKKQGIYEEAELNSHFTSVQFGVLILND